MSGSGANTLMSRGIVDTKTAKRISSISAYHMALITLSGVI
jgi:hypothetical protein